MPIFLKCPHRSYLFWASEMGEKVEHSGWIKLRNSRPHIHIKTGKIRHWRWQCFYISTQFTHV